MMQYNASENINLRWRGLIVDWRGANQSKCHSQSHHLKVKVATQGQGHFKVISRTRSVSVRGGHILQAWAEILCK